MNLTEAYAKLDEADILLYRAKNNEGEFKNEITNLIDPEKLKTLYLEMLEETIDRAPAYWLWSHKRWMDAKATVVADNKN